MGAIDTFRDFVGDIADDTKRAFDDLLDRDDDWWDDDCDWWDDDCDWWDDDCDWERRRRRGRRRGRRGPRQTRRRNRQRRIVEEGARHPALAEPSRRRADPELAEQVRQLSSTVESLRASLSTQPENRT